MKFQISTPVNGHYQKVYKSFNKELFKKLNPNSRIIQLKQFQGTKPGNRFKLVFPFSQKWEGIITEVKESQNYCYFTDEGLRLPFGLTQWRHRHWIIKRTDEDSIITEDIHYRSKSLIINYLLFPFIWTVIYMRRYQYKRLFK